MVKKSVLFSIIFVFTFSMLVTGCSSTKDTSLKDASKAASFPESTKAIDKDTQAALIKFIDGYTKTGDFSGTVLVAKDGDVLLNRGFGMADEDKKIANTPQTAFEIASVTKQFTATAILMLQERNLLNVQDPLSKYIPDYPNGDKIKLTNLLTHTSGITDYYKFLHSIDSGKHNYTPEELIGLFKNKPLDFETGTKFEYSNSNYILLGYIIQKLTKMKYEDFIQKNIFKPLNLNHTGFLRNPPTNLACGYYNDIITYHQEPTLSYAAGEIYSTDEDLYKWQNALFSGKIIKKELLNEMFTPNLENYGYGWFINKSQTGDKLIYHGGNTLGYTSFLERDFDKNYVIIILCNQQYNNSIITMKIPDGLFKILNIDQQIPYS